MRSPLLKIFWIVGWMVNGLTVGGDEPLPREALQSLRRATRFFQDQVSAEGGYLWRYSEDLSKREGEGRAEGETVWVQPPGTPSVGMALIDAFEATGDRYYLNVARDAGLCLVRGQLRSGGWDYRIEFNPQRRQRYAYRVDRMRAEARNTTTLDDDTTQAALRLLMRLDRTFDFNDGHIHEAAEFALASLLKAQYPNGAWPQRYHSVPNADARPVKQASYPESWSRTFPGRNYSGFYTFNDNVIADVIDVMFVAERTYHNKRYREAAENAGNFILLAQMPEPQPAWAQQYDGDMHPAWARKFEPPSITGGESQGVLRTLLRLYRDTGKETYFKAVPRAVEYLRQSQLSDGRLARFYELKTNRPLYFTRGYQLTYEDDDLPTHYSFKVGSSLDSINREYQQLLKSAPEPSALSSSSRSEILTSLSNQVRDVIAALDEKGRWVEDGRLKYHGANDKTRRIIDSHTFIRNIQILSHYLTAMRP